MNLIDVQFSFKRYALYERGMKPKSYKSIMASVKMLCIWAETKEIEKLDQGMVQSFLYWGREERAWEPKTFRNHWQYLRLFFAWCIKKEMISTNPVQGIERPRLPQRLPRCISKEDVQSVLNHVRWYPWRYRFEAVRNEMMIYLLVFTGLRLQEMLNLETGDINLSSGEILVRQGKGRKDRIIPIHPQLMPVLRNYMAARKDCKNFGCYFITSARSQKPISGKDVRSVCSKLSKVTRIYFTPHMLRHTFGRLMVEAGVDIFKIKEMMGHADITTTQGYLSVSTQNLKQSLNALTLL